MTTEPTRYEFHPLANIFPLMEGADFDELVSDIKATQKLNEPITIYEGKILEGRNRYRACLSAGVDPVFVPFLEDDPLAFVISANLRRMHYDASQRAMIAANLATLKQGARTDLSPTGEMSQADAATLLNVGKRSVERAREVQARGAPELQHAVEQGKVSVSAAVDIASLPKDEQDEIVARGPREILLKAQELRAVLTEQRRAERIARAVELSAHNAPLPADRKYSLILADPPWRYEFSKTSTRAIEAKYPTMSIEDICALPVSDLAGPIAVLFLWVPSAVLEQGFDVIRSWGFAYASCGVWDKGKFGTGFYFRQQHEHLLVATRGDMPAPPAHARPPSVIQAPRREHSQKPDEAYELIERMYPDLPRIELFARQRREGWQAWGNQAGEDPPMMEVDAPPIAVDLDNVQPLLDRTTSPQPA